MASDSIILGINAYHADAAACIVRYGKLAAEEERFRRIKHWAGFPAQAVKYCLREAGIDLDDVTHVAVNRNNRANFFVGLAMLRFSGQAPVCCSPNYRIAGRSRKLMMSSTGYAMAGHLPAS